MRIFFRLLLKIRAIKSIAYGWFGITKYPENFQ
jgi:hypothetical protein